MDYYTSIQAEVRIDEDTGEKYYRLSGDGWKDSEDTKDNPQFDLQTLPVGAIIRLLEPMFTIKQNSLED